MESTDICFFTIGEASQLIRRKELSPLELLHAHLKRIKQTEGKLNSFITQLEDDALTAARRCEAEIQDGCYLGPLHGIPIGLKDLYYTKGIRTTMGSKIMRDFVPAADATVADKFKKVGAILIGKLQMHEFALGPTSENPHYGPAHNPWDLCRVTGGSSGGSGSAVAAGQCMGALGSDTGGSIRIPASLCGIVGLKPTFGRVSRYGVYPLSWSLDTVGPMTRTVHDAALLLNAIAGYDARDPSSCDMPTEDFTTTLKQGVKGLRVGIPREYFFDVIDPEVRETVLKAAQVLEGLGTTVEEVSIPALQHSLAISGTILLTEAASIHLDHLRHRAEDLGADILTRLQAGAMTPAIDYLKAQRARTVFNREMATAFKGLDVLLTPTEPIVATKIGERTIFVKEREQMVLPLLSRLTRPFNVSGLPAVSVPCGFDSSGLPIGMQLVGRAFDEATVLRMAYAYEQATDWHTRRPPLR